MKFASKQHYTVNVSIISNISLYFYMKFIMKLYTYLKAVKQKLFQVPVHDDFELTQSPKFLLLVHSEAITFYNT